jgi:CRP/FNR family transcriptional regulator, cyclic AMP receptor protein
MNHDTRPAGEKEFADSFISYVLRRYVKIEADLVDQLFNSSESSRAAVGERSALAGPLRQGRPAHGVLPKVSQETLAEMIGTTRPRVNFVMNKFKKLA